METTLRPTEGFTSVNTSSLGIEHETLNLETTPDGAKIIYVNDVEVRSLFFRILGRFLLKRVALRYWERAIIDKLRKMLEK